ncbi:MAG: hypothetical protein AABX75_02715 [Nanoarchaeota archaeon]
MPSYNPNWNEFVHNVANDISDIVGNPNQITITNQSAFGDIYEFNIRCKGGRFSLRFSRRDLQSLEFLACEAPPGLVKSALPQIVKYAKDCKNTNMKARFEHKYAIFLDKLESDLKSVLGADIVRIGSAFKIKYSNELLLELHPLANRRVNIFACNERVRGRIHIVADAYRSEFSVDCRMLRPAVLEWRANASKQQA